LGVLEATLWVKDGPSYIPKDDELRDERTDGYTLLCVPGQHCYTGLVKIMLTLMDYFK